jgi:hypothetical protein
LRCGFDADFFAVVSSAALLMGFAKNARNSITA